MAKAKKTADAATVVDANPLDSRIALFFKVQPFGKPMGTAELALDLPDAELKSYVSNDDADAIVKRMQTDGFQVPEKKDEQRLAGRAKAVELALNKLVNDGVLERQAINEPGAPPVAGWVYKGSRADAATKIEVVKVPIDSIKVDEKLQCRAKGSNLKKVDEYAAVADQLPAGRCYRLPDGTLLLSRGFTRMKAWAQAGVQVVPMEIVDGTRDDAKLDAIGDNAEHGLARTADDIMEAIGKFLSLPGKKNSSVASVANAVKCAWATARKGIKKWRTDTGTPEPTHVETASGELYPTRIAGNLPTDGTAPEAEIPRPDAGAPIVLAAVYDKLGNLVPADTQPAFTDDRFGQALKNILLNMEFLRTFTTSGYSLTNILLPERVGMLNEMEFQVVALQQSQPYAVCPADAGDTFSSAVRRGWMTQAEWNTYRSGLPGPGKKKGGKKKGGDEPTATPTEPATTEPAPTATPEPVAESAPNDDTPNASDPASVA